MDGERNPQNSVIRIKPQQYIHVLDNNTGVTRLEVGPQTVTLRDHERLVLGPRPMVVIPPRYYCMVNNPVLRDASGAPLSDAHGQIKLRYGDAEIRFEQEPFALYPGEELSGDVTRLRVVEINQALRLRALRDFLLHDKEERRYVAGQEWLFEGPGTYIPRVEVEVVESLKATVIKPNQALRLIAREACVDRLGNARCDGEEWLVRTEGAYLPGVYEGVVGLINAYVLTERKALHLRARRTFTDVLKQERKAGDEWLVTIQDAETHIPDVYEEVMGEVAITTLNDREWCVVMDPIGSDGKPQLGKREVRKGRLSFFLHPGESLEGGIQKVYVLGEQEALLLRATEAFRDAVMTPPQERTPGDLWMIAGPADYIPPVQVEVVERRKAIPLDKNEGIYVRDVMSGELRLVRGPQAYMLKPYEELWEKPLSAVIEELLAYKSDPLAERSKRMGEPGDTAQRPAVKRDRTRAVVFHVPQNAAVQIHDYKARTARVVFGPDLVMLGPDESFTVLSLSGDKPKRPNVIKSLALLLGPDFMTDIFTVETADHARLRLQLSYNWHFEMEKDEQQAVRLFQVPDFVGDACKAVASRVRGAVASSRFEEFHRNSAKIIRSAVFGLDDKGHVREDFRFPANGLVITNIDIQSVEPIDEETLKSLQKSVQIAIKITTDAQEAAARQDAARIEQEARARLERQGIIDKSQSEAERKKLLELEAENAAVEATGHATAGARANAEAERIKGETAVMLARQQSDGLRITSEAELAMLRAQQEAEIEHQRALNEMEIARAEQLAQITAQEFRSRVEAIGADTLRAMAQAGPELQARLLAGLGLQSVLITDGNSPINLFGTAAGLLGNLTGGALRDED